MNHDLHHCDGEITPGELCPRRILCERFIAHEDAVKQKLEYVAYLSAYCCSQAQYTISGQVYDKIPYNDFRETHESRPTTTAKPLHKPTRKSRTSSSKSEAH